MPLWTDLVPFGFNPLGGCHDIQVYVEKKLAAAACASVGQLWDISDPANPKTLDPFWEVDEPDVDFYRSAAFTWDAKVIIFGDEALEGNCSGTQGQLWFHRPASGATLGSFQIPRVQGVDDYCSAHLFNVLQTGAGYRLVASWYTGGLTVVDFTRPNRAREVAFYDPFWPVTPRACGPPTPTTDSSTATGSSAASTATSSHPQGPARRSCHRSTRRPSSTTRRTGPPNPGGGVAGCACG